MKFRVKSLELRIVSAAQGTQSPFQCGGICQIDSGMNTGTRMTWVERMNTGFFSASQKKKGF